MFKVIDKGNLFEDNQKYLSFPDIIKSSTEYNVAFLVYRSANSHHPYQSCLHFCRSNNLGGTWKEQFTLKASLLKDGYVWNCPRLSYIPDGGLVILCDTKNHVQEHRSLFQVVIININPKGSKAIRKKLLGFQGMVPDSFVLYRGNLLCANHTKDTNEGRLAQKVNWSRDNGRTFIDCNLIARDPEKDFCEASIINYKNKTLLAYMRENSKSVNPIYVSYSTDVVNWTSPEPISITGHRVTAQCYNNDIIGTFRNTKDMSVSIFRHNMNNLKDIETCNIDSETPENIYNFGYTGFINISRTAYYIVYYIKRDRIQPFIAYAVVESN